jgi:hypothetical protein
MKARRLGLPVNGSICGREIGRPGSKGVAWSGEFLGGSNRSYTFFANGPGIVTAPAGRMMCRLSMSLLFLN